AQFQTDKSVVEATRSGRQVTEDLTDARQAIECHLGDFMTYANIREEISQLENSSAKQRRAQWKSDVESALRSLVPGDVIHVPKQGWCVVLAVSNKEAGAQVISADHTVLRIRPHDLVTVPQPVTRIRVP